MWVSSQPILFGLNVQQQPLEELLLMIDGQIIEVRLDKIMEHIKMLDEQVITFNNVSSQQQDYQNIIIYHAKLGRHACTSA
jgi:hypothetical protein